MSLALSLFALGVLFNAFFAGYETGFVSSNLIRVRHLAEKAGDLSARRLLRHLEAPDLMITVLLIGTNLALIMGTMAITHELGTFWAAIVATPMFIIFGEILPKSVFRLHPTTLSLKLLPVIQFFDLLLRPIVAPTAWLSSRFLRLVEAEQRDIRKMATSQADMRVLIDESAEHGSLETEEQEMIHSVMDLQHRLAKEVMVPRIDISALPEAATRQELIALLNDSGHTRIPIYRGSVDQIIGVVSAFAILTDTAAAQDGSIRPYIKEIMHVPDTMRVGDVLKKMRDTRQRMAIVTDEYGGTDGLITVEDILEEIFGEIHDEHDKHDVRIRRVGPNAFVADARMPLSDAAEAMDVEIIDEEVETVGGWLMHVTGRIPQKGELIKHERFHIMVLDGGPSYVDTIRIEVMPEPGENKAETK